MLQCADAELADKRTTLFMKVDEFFTCTFAILYGTHTHRIGTGMVWVGKRQFRKVK